MGIKLTKASDAAHKRLSILIFGEPKIGKTTLAKTLPVSDDSKLLYIAADPGQLALRDRDFVVVRPENGELSEKFFDDVLDLIRTSGNEYEWIVIDGVDEVADAILRSKQAVEPHGLRAFGMMASYVEQWMKAIRDTDGVNVVFITHIEQKEAGDGEVQFHPMFPGKEIQRHVNEWFDMIGCMRLVRGSDNSFKRFIQFRREADMRFIVGDRAGVTDLYERPDLGALVTKIHKAGFETRGEWKEPRVTSDMLLAFGKGRSTTEIDGIKTTVQEKYGKGIKELTIPEFNEFVAAYKESA